MRVDAEADLGEGCKRARKTGKEINKEWLTCAAGDVPGITDEVLEAIKVVEGVGEAGVGEEVWGGTDDRGVVA